MSVSSAAAEVRIGPNVPGPCQGIAWGLLPGRGVGALCNARASASAPLLSASPAHGAAPSTAPQVRLVDGT